ncbi:murein transglycosylase domain-containing protein [Congregibacter brevis]|uniref:Murein transglycosylase domain-containing protein n=1 Tax=Congregibacter brevis TaxID=3081201 RepID=A0ABZ0IAY0_9GAMM|nr:murein transglycosylase domain-containing protein [Congregibacter sp. IMCC45268]
MTLRAIVATLSLGLMLGSCANPSQTVIDATLSGDPERIARAVLEDQLQRQGVPTDIEGLPELIEAVSGLLAEIWGEKEPEIASEHRYVKYSNAYEARAIIDFDAGWLQVETIASEDPIDKLRQAIISTLLTTRDMSVHDIFTDASPPVDGEPFLLGQVLDADDQPIRWQWRAERFADYLLAHVLKTSRKNGKVLRSVRAALVKDHLHLREIEYADFVLAAARRYAVEPSWIYAVIEVESAFNPYAVSPASAYGLMQVVPASAGRDVYQRVKNLKGEPSKQELFKPDFNIDIGSAYLHLLDDTYLNNIDDPKSRQFVAISSYNGGVGNALRAFDANSAVAVRRINAINPSEVYRRLVTDHPFAETRRYLEKVQSAQRKYL